jgi:transcriptional regulator with XRE-family HTH domain
MASEITLGELGGRPAAEYPDGMSASTPIGERLRAIRGAAGITQSALAERLGFESQSSISMIETGARQPDLDLIERWAEACGVEARLLFGPPPADRELQGALQALLDLPPDGPARAALLGHLQAWATLAGRGGPR